MNKDKTKEQLLAELDNLRKQSKEQEDKLKAANQQLEAHNQQLQANEEALKASEERLDLAMMIKNEGTWDWNLVSNQVDFDERYYTMAGYDPGDFANNLEEFQKRVHPEDVDYVMSTAEQYMAGQIEQYQVEFRFKRKDGTWMWIHARGQIVERDENGIPLRFIGTHSDITERKQAEEKLRVANQQLRATEQQLRAANQQLEANNQQLITTSKKLKKEKVFSEKIVETTDAIIVGLDKDHIIRIFNQGAEHITGYKKEEVIGKDWFKIFFPKEMQDEMNKVWKDSWGVKSHSYINPILAKSGEERIVSWQTTGMYDSDDVSEHLVLSIGEDVTDRKQAEEALKESEEKFRALYDNAPLSYQSLNEDGSFKDVNPSWMSTLGYKRDEVIGKFYKDFLHPDYKPPFEKNFPALKKSGYVHDVQYRIRHKEGHYLDISFEGCVGYNPDGSFKQTYCVFQDITERKKAEIKLKESEERFNLAMNASNDGLFDWNLLTNEIYYSPAWKKMIGYEDHELPNDFSVWETTTEPEDVKKSWELQQKLISKEVDRFEMKFKMKHKEGHWVDILSRARAIFNDEGKAIRMIGTHTDITERKQAEKELTKLSTAVKQSPSVIAITDTNGNLEYANPKFTELTGYSFDEAIGQNPRVLKSGEQSDEMYKEFWETISSGKTWRGEFHNKKKNGELFWESASISPIFDEQGKIINYIKVAEDITERKQAEDNFKHSIDDSPLGIRIVNQAGKTIYVNKALMDIYEFSSLNEFNNTKAIDRYTGKSYQEHLKRKKIREKGGDVSDYEISIRRKNGEIRYIKVWRKEVIWNREKHFQVINQDITKLERLTTDLILAKEKAEESDRLKSAFLANMSHEIRTPMNGILGFTELLKEPQLTGDEKDEFILIIEKSGTRMLNTINDIVNISKIEAGQVEVVKSEVSVNKLLEEQYNFFYNEAKSKGLELNYKPSLTDSESRIITDKHKLEGILINLIKNAIKFTKTGSITFGYAIKTLGEKDVVEFYVKDTGIGIPANRVDAVFNRFEQADIEDTRVFEGSGLGLAIAKSYVEMLGGKISVESKEGEGSTFTFSIPYTKQLVKERDGKENINKEPQIALSHLSLIIAEDDETSRMFLETILKNQVKRITYTTTGKETIEKFREDPDTGIILMDIKMPEMNGYDATREIRKFNSDVVIIAQTAYRLSGDREKALEAGCDDYIAKPIKKEILFEKIQACLDKKSN